MSHFLGVVVWPWLATKGHKVTLSPLPPLGWEGEWKEKGKTHRLGYGHFNRTAKEVNSNNNSADKKNIQNKTVKCTERLSPASAPPEPR